MLFLARSVSHVNTGWGRIIYGTGVEEIPISDLATHLKRIYTNHVGYEIMHLESLEEREWLKEQIESSNLERSEAERLTYYKVALITGCVAFQCSLHMLLQLLLRSEAFDHFMQRKFPMIKRIVSYAMNMDSKSSKYNVHRIRLGGR